MRRIHLGIALLLLVHVPVTARAVDGVLEINQACALNTGCFPGDSPGYPVTLSLSAQGTVNVRLTSNLTTGSGGTTFIELSSSTGGIGNPSTVIDLNGFSMSCFDLFAGCSGTGIGVSAAGFRRVTVMNGGIAGVGSDGVQLGDDCIVKDLRITGVGGVAIHGGDNCQVLRNTMELNGSGILAGDGALVANNVVADTFPGGSGGIALGDACTVIRNVARDNSGPLGIRNFTAGSTCGYGQNVFTNSGNPDGGVSALPIEIGTNVCGNNTTCP